MLPLFCESPQEVVVTSYDWHLTRATRHSMESDSFGIVHPWSQLKTQLLFLPSFPKTSCFFWNTVTPHTQYNSRDKLKRISPLRIQQC